MPWFVLFDLNLTEKENLFSVFPVCIVLTAKESEFGPLHTNWKWQLYEFSDLTSLKWIGIIEPENYSDLPTRHLASTSKTPIPRNKKNQFIKEKEKKRNNIS